MSSKAADDDEAQRAREEKKKCKRKGACQGGVASPDGEGSSIRDSLGMDQKGETYICRVSDIMPKPEMACFSKNKTRRRLLSEGGSEKGKGQFFEAWGSSIGFWRRRSLGFCLSTKVDDQTRVSNGNDDTP